MDKMTPRSIAIHEAGHAVAGVLLHRGVRRATVVPDESLAGHAVFGPLRRKPRVWPPIPEERIERQIMCILAGLAAELLAEPRGEGTIDVDDEGARGDYQHAYQLAFEHLPVGATEDADAVISRLGAKTTQLLNENWRAVEAVADELLAQHTLSRNQIVAIMTRTPAHPDHA